MNIITFLILLFCSILSSFGLGGGNIYIIYLTVFHSIEQKAAQGKNLFLYIPCAFLSVCIYAYKKMLSYKLIVPILIGGVLGTFLGAFLLTLIKPKVIKFVFSIFLFIQGIKILFVKKKA